MLVKYLGKNKDYLRTGEKYKISYSCNKHGASVMIDGYGGYAYDSIADLALDWDILGDKFVRAEVMEDYMSSMVRLP
jgi:hypothetical protein